MPKNHSDLKIVLFCGGSGTRMWPLSRKDKPKQFQPLVGETSMFQQALERIKKGFPIEDIHVITGRQYIDIVIKQAPDLPLENIIIEPEMRDTLAAVGYAAAIMDSKYNNPIVASLWAADHLVKDPDEFVRALKVAYDFAKESGKMVSVDVKPTYPNIHVGYIKIGKMIKKLNGLAIFEYIKQIEKPDLATAKKYASSWEYLWHAGYKVWHAQKMLDLYKKHTPKVYAGLKEIQDAWGGDKQDKTVNKIYPNFEKDSVDFAVFEKIDPREIVVLAADIGWSDIGAWNILKEELAKSAKDNLIKGDVVDIDSEDSLIYAMSSDKIVATIGLNNLVVVDTKDALLVCQKDRISDIKKIIEKIKETKQEKFL